MGTRSGYLSAVFLVCSLYVFQCEGMPTTGPKTAGDENQIETSYSIYILHHEGSDKPCLAAKMASHAKVSYRDIDNEERYASVHLPNNATVRGSCVEPRWMEISWLDHNGLHKSLKFSYDEKRTLRQQTEDSYVAGGILIEKVEFKTLIDEYVFPGTLKSGESLTATSENLEIFQSASNCGNHTVDLHSAMGPMSLSLTDVQFKEDISEFSDDEKCDGPTGVDTVAIAVGCFLAAIILSAVVSYAFGQWWRSRAEQRN
ncbi:hypothetical protein J437_LFUL012446 [Ladona fulva]|uniref:Uncharacterized protein n=1 Tax=Ladona fulva TaxID=123851 RepID=A0A8K0P3U1_LADFU|nr:hypothetical protein J437_LFUL012446 [Ladona fulva]